MKDKKNKQVGWNKKQVLMFLCWYGGMIFTLSLLFLPEIPNIIKEGAGWTLIIIIPVLFWVNRLMILNVIKEWKRK